MYGHRFGAVLSDLRHRRGFVGLAAAPPQSQAPARLAHRRLAAVGPKTAAARVVGRSAVVAETAHLAAGSWPRWQRRLDWTSWLGSFSTLRLLTLASCVATGALGLSIELGCRDRKIRFRIAGQCVRSSKQ